MIEVLEKAIRDRMVAGTALAALLAGSAAVYNLVAPDDATYDFVVFDCDYTTDNERHGRGEDVILTVRSCSETGLQKAGSIDGAVDTLFHEQALTVTGWSNFWCARRRGFNLHELRPGGSSTWMAVAEYDVWMEEG